VFEAELLLSDAQCDWPCAAHVTPDASVGCGPYFTIAERPDQSLRELHVERLDRAEVESHPDRTTSLVVPDLDHLSRAEGGMRN
jgi:hypothetical protein